MIGSITLPVAVSAIQSIPGGMVTSDFYEYDNTYVIASVLEPGKGYWVRVREDGKLILSSTLSSQVVTAASRIRIQHSDDQPPLPPGKNHTDPLPAGFSLGQNYPNPFNSTTRFDVGLPRTANVDVSVYNLLGEKIAALMHGGFIGGFYRITWDGTTNRGGVASSGIYIVKMSADTYTGMIRIVLIK